MLDSTTVNDIPKSALMVAGYVNGIWPTFNALVKAFPHAHHVSIDVNGSAFADVLDVEKGDATPAQAPDWVVRQRARGTQPIVYMDRSTWPAVIAAFKSAKIAEPFFWVADFTGVAHLLPGAVGVQYADGTSQYPGIAPHCDSSLVSPNWPGLATPTPSAAVLAHYERQLMLNPAMARVAIKNKWQLYVWNGVGFTNAPAKLAKGTHLYASVFYRTMNPNPVA
jgi:hypothetical protein